MTTSHSTTTHNLMFLLAAAPMGMACVIVTDDTEDTTGADTGNATTGGQTTEADTAGTDTNPVTGEGTGSSGDTTRGETTAVADSTGADSTGADSTGGGSSADCQAFGDHNVKCMVPYAEYSADSCTYSQMSVETYYPECAVLFDEYVACLTMLSCEELNGVGPCADEAAALAAMGCPTIE